jgi:transcriptional regulator with XRE-family HTH domain
VRKLPAAKKACRLEPVEFRCLRKRAPWTASDLEHALGVCYNVTISSWETGSRSIPVAIDRLFRLHVTGVLTNVSLWSLAEQFKTPWRQAGAPLTICLNPDPMPRMRWPLKWGEIKRQPEEEVINLFQICTRR